MAQNQSSDSDLHPDVKSYLEAAERQVARAESQNGRIKPKDPIVRDLVFSIRDLCVAIRLAVGLPTAHDK